MRSRPDDVQLDQWPPGYGQLDVASIDGVTLVPEGKAVLFLTAVDGLKVALVIEPGQLLGAARQIVAHVAPKRMIAIDGGKL